MSLEEKCQDNQVIQEKNEPKVIQTETRSKKNKKQKKKQQQPSPTIKQIVEYIWLGGNNEFRSKTRVLENIYGLKDVPKWNFDGSSTCQASGEDSEIILNPCAFYNDPLRKGNHKLVLCETYKPNGEPCENNHRKWALNIMNKQKTHEPMFGLEQEYFLINPYTHQPLGYDENQEQGQFYCGVGTFNVFGRVIVDEHLSACIEAGIQMSGTNAEVAPGQWEFQVGPCIGIDAGDQLLMARYLLVLIAEKYHTCVNYEPKPLKGKWNGSGCHTNFSTKEMRHGTKKKKGITFINQAIEKLSKKHIEHMDVYGSGNEERMTGKYETASYDTFSSGIANRGASIRIGNENYKNKKGYFEDRRPSSNCNPYLVTGKLVDTILC